MSHPDASQFVAVRFYETAVYTCSYLPGIQARSQVAIPSEAIDRQVYSQLIRIGFRRSGLYTYRPYCDACRSCTSVRIPVARFAPDRSQRRTQKRLQSLTALAAPLKFSEEHYQLYRRYQQARHMDGGMSADDPMQYAEFLLKSSVESWLIEFRDGEQLKMVSLIDCLDDGLSAVYTFYDPDDARAGFGVYNVLWQVELARIIGLPHVYLGYWIEGCRKMSYKSAYQPLEKLQDGLWVPF
jgi:arginyl-tRNA--protein-N-Asp/Glu arginylyltransferase